MDVQYDISIGAYQFLTAQEFKVDVQIPFVYQLSGYIPQNTGMLNTVNYDGFTFSSLGACGAQVICAENVDSFTGLFAAATPGTVEGWISPPVQSVGDPFFYVAVNTGNVSPSPYFSYGLITWVPIDGTIHETVLATPEPGFLTLFLTGLILIAVKSRRRRITCHA